MGFKTTDAEMKMLVRESAWGWGAVAPRIKASSQTGEMGRVAFLFEAQLPSVANIAVLMAGADCQLERILDHPGDS